MPSDGPTVQVKDAEWRLRQLILHVATYCQKAGFGSVELTRLNKVLFYSDFSAYLRLGKAITNWVYLALEWGPAPKGIVAVWEKMREEKEIQVIEAMGKGESERAVIPLLQADLRNFSAEEISIVDQAIGRFVFGLGRHEASRQFIGWEAAQPEEIIPYSAAHLDAAHILGEESSGIGKSAVEHARKLEAKAAQLIEKYA